MIGQVETQMRKLKLARLNLTVSKEKVLREVSWMAELNDDSFAILLDAAQERVYEVGEYLVKQGDLALGDQVRHLPSSPLISLISPHLPPSMPLSHRGLCVSLGDQENVYLVSRGIVEIVEEYENGESSVVARRGSGVVIGEQSLLTGSPRAASARACTSVMALGLPHAAMKLAMERYPDLEMRMWHHVGKNLAQKLLGDDEEHRLGERVSTAEELTSMADTWVPSIKAVRNLPASPPPSMAFSHLLPRVSASRFHLTPPMTRSSWSGR